MRRSYLRKQKTKIDRQLLFLALLLTGIGLIVVADASAPQALAAFNDKFYFFKQQALWGLFGIVLLFIFSNVHYSFWEKLATPIFILGVLSLLVVLIPGVGVRVLGARRWLYLGPLSFQPSEFIKLALAMYLAKVSGRGKRPFSYFIPLALVSLLIMAQPDLGTTIVVLLIGISQIFVSGVSVLYILGSSAFAALAAVVLILLSPYRRERLTTYLAQSHDPLGSSYHIRQVLLALGSGGLLGVGLGQSRQKYLFLPEAATDSIFAIIGEEVGFVGASVIIFLFVLFILKGLAIAKSAPDRFSQTLGGGIVAWLGGQAFLNIASMVAVVPLTGVPLPFFSYGGSSLTMMLAATGILLNISKYAK